MTFKDILVHIDNRPTCDSRLDVAIGVAARQQSHLTGIYFIPYPLSSNRPAAKTAEVEQSFRKKVAAAGLQCDWICLDSSKTDLDLPNALNLYAHYRDLLIISQTDTADPNREIPGNLPEKAVLGSGRPTLLVPYIGANRREFNHILLAWRGGPESSRALHDAMPLLRQAKKITVITVQGREGDDVYQSHDADICRHLTRYNLPLTCEKHISADLSVGDMLLNRSAELGVDLLVMGAAMQLRRGYQTLGETGRHLLKHMTVPVLMSH